MKRTLLMVGLLALACGPSEAKKTADECRAAFAAKNWHAAEVICDRAANLNPQDHQLALYHADAIVYGYTEGLDARMTAMESQLLREREVAAQEAEAAAKERAARAAAYDAIINGKH
jgi:hypothetical protein